MARSGQGKASMGPGGRAGRWPVARLAGQLWEMNAAAGLNHVAVLVRQTQFRNAGSKWMKDQQKQERNSTERFCLTLGC